MITLYGENQDIDLKWWTFPGGERSVSITYPNDIIRLKTFTVSCFFEGSNDLIDMLLLVNAIRNISNTTRLRLFIPYFPFARQDRVMSTGEPLSLQVAVQLIKLCNFYEVEVWDPHSDVLAGMFEPGKLLVVPQVDCTSGIMYLATSKENSYLVSPDVGALKKIFTISKKTNLPVVLAGKVRDVKTGEILSTKVDLSNVDNTSNPTFIIVDDICDGGKTFIEIAKEIRAVYGRNCEIKLVVTHGIFSKGLTVFSGLIDKIYACNNMSNLNIMKFNRGT